jgi:hypothetical protein
MTNLKALMPALRDMLAKERDKKIKDVGERAAAAHPELIERIKMEYFAAESALVIGNDLLGDIHRIADALEGIIFRLEEMEKRMIR